VFEGSTIQRGHGIGDVLRGLAKSTLPLLKQGGKMLGKQLLSTGANIVKDAIDGKNFADSARDNFRQGGLNLLSNISSKIEGGRRRPPKRSRAPPRSRRLPPRKKPRRHGPRTLLANVNVKG
jgi:hypothetical protein